MEETPQAAESIADPTFDVETDPTQDSALHTLELQLSKAQKRIDELARALLASERDRDEFKQRSQRERERLLDVEKGKVAVALVESVDELELCLRGQENSAFVQGVRLIRDGLLKKLHGLGAERVQLLGLPFDPNFAEAADIEVCPEEEHDGQVTLELRSCFRLNGKVIRAGLVRVARFVTPAQA
jgi:molecular chaperone GrpE